jgi:hypothetical protein
MAFIEQNSSMQWPFAVPLDAMLMGAHPPVFPQLNDGVFGKELPCNYLPLFKAYILRNNKGW